MKPETLLKAVKQVKKGILRASNVDYAVQYTDLLMKKIRKIDYPLVGGQHYFHRLLTPYSVSEWFILPENQWTEIHDFEAYQHSYATKPPENFTIEQFWKWADKDPNCQKMRKLIKRAGGHQVWQFNAQIEPWKDDQEGDYDYVRQVAIFAQITMKELSSFEEKIYYPYLRFKAKILNLYVYLYNQLVLLNSLSTKKAIKAIDNGLTISTLDYGARQILFKKIDGILNISWPFHHKEWTPCENNKLPNYIKNFIKYKE